MRRMLISRITEFLADRAISALETATAYRNRSLRFGLPAATIMLAAAFTCAQPLQAASARKLVQEGNEAYGEGKYDEALKSYEQAAEEEPGSPHIPFNKGAALYRQGDYSKALDEFQKAAAAGSVAEDRELEARAHYNAGNSFVRMSEQQKAAPRGALDLLGRGVDAYRRALQLDSALTDAAHNLEVARMQMKQLLEQAQQNPQGGQGQQDSQNQDLPQQLQDLLNQQQQASNEGEKLSEQQQQQGDSQQLQEQSQKLSEKQRDIQEQTEQLARQMEQQQQQQQQQQKQSQSKQSQPPPQQQEIQKNLDEASSRQQQAQQKLDQKQLSAANEDQKKAEDALRQALDAAKGKPGPQTQEQQQAQAQPQPEEPQQQPETPSEAPESEQVTEGQGDEAPNEAARDILDEERANRKQRQIRQMKGTRPVEKDW